MHYPLSSHDHLLEQGEICEEIDKKEDEGGQELEQEGGCTTGQQRPLPSR